MIVGNGGVGKSAIAIQFMQNLFIESDPTIEDSYRKLFEVNGKTYALEMLDTAGEEEFSCLRDQYIAAAQGYLIVYSITCEASFKEAEALAQRIKTVKDTDRLAMVFVGNKCDLEDCRKVNTIEGEELAKRHNGTFLETSAKCRINIRDVFVALVNEYEKASINGTPKRPKKEAKCLLS